MTQRDFEPLPYYRWYWRDARASRRWQRMHHFARAIYRELLDECWAKGCIPDDPAECADVIGWPESLVVRYWATVRAMFEDVGDGMLINERMENERTDSDRQRARRVVNGRRGGKASGEARRSKSKQIEAVASGVEASSSSSSKEQSNSSSAASRAGPETGPRLPQHIGEGPILRAFRAEGLAPPDKLVS